MLYGESLKDILKNAGKRVVVVAPFIKLSAFREIKQVMSDDIQEFICITRWLPQDIASGVCDISIFDEIKEIDGGRLLIHPQLHGKYYSNGYHTLVGSANLTGRGLGWRIPSNFELMVTMPAREPSLVAWESELIATSIVVTEQLKQEIQNQASLIQKGEKPVLPIEVATDDEELVKVWVPKCPVPERLWDVYIGQGEDNMVSYSYTAAKRDLGALSPPEGLSRSLFYAYLSVVLRQTPLIRELDSLAQKGISDNEAKALLAEYCGDSIEKLEYDETWRIVKDWLVHFFPSSFRIETDQEILIKGREIRRE